MGQPNEGVYFVYICTTYKDSSWKCTSAIMRQLKTTREIKVMDEVTLQTLQRAQDSIKEK